MEWELPIPGPVGTEKRDYDTIQRAWCAWLFQGHLIVFISLIGGMEARPDAPVRVALELRLTGPSDVILAPQRGNTYGTTSIEVLTMLTTPKKDWSSFCQGITDRWTSCTDADGQSLNPRPH